MEKIKENINKEFTNFCKKTFDNLRMKIYSRVKDEYITDEVLQNTYLIASKKSKYYYLILDRKGCLTNRVEDSEFLGAVTEAYYTILLAEIIMAVLPTGNFLPASLRNFINPAEEDLI